MRVKTSKNGDNNKMIVTRFEARSLILFPSFINLL